MNWNIVVVPYTFAGYIFALYLLIQSDITFLQWIAAVILLAHTLTYSSYLHHELAHNLVFNSLLLNEYFGMASDWLNGGCYFKFSELRELHRLHHNAKVDFVTVNKVQLLARFPRPFYDLIKICEFCYIPAYTYLAGARASLSPFWKPERKNQRLRVTIVIAARLAFFILIGKASLAALIGYFISFCYCTQALRFTDVYGHLYDFVPLSDIKNLSTKSKDYDMSRTYSLIEKSPYNLISALLFLNFNFHNAHHYNTNISWWNLPEKHNAIRSTIRKEEFELSMGEALGSFHKGRLRRLTEKSGNVGKPSMVKGKLSMEGYLGEVDAPFLELEV